MDAPKAKSSSAKAVPESAATPKAKTMAAASKSNSVKSAKPKSSPTTTASSQPKASAAKSTSKAQSNGATQPTSSKATAKPSKTKASKSDAAKVVKATTKTVKKVVAKSAAKTATPPEAVTQKTQAVASAPARSMPAALANASEKKVAPASRTPEEATVAAPTPPEEIAETAVAAQQQPSGPKKPVSQRHGFKTNEFVVYPAHGVGRIVGIEEQEIAGMALELFVITFEKDKMTLRVPTGKLESVGMRKLAEDTIVQKAMDTLKGRARVKRTMWSRRAQEYEAKINSGDLVSIAEVVRDLYRSEQQPEQSYSERQLYEAALDRMAREIAAVEKMDERGAVQRITGVLSRSAKGRRMAAEGEVEGEAEAVDSSDEVKAA